MRKDNLCTSLLVLTAIALPIIGIAQQVSQPLPPSSPPPKPAVHKASTPPSDGERIFAQNCSRCHTAPDGFSSRISGTVARHMRVRAGLSKQDEEALLRFFNP
jgi:cytochrome c5